jgi:hypothetical protein
MSCKIMIMSAVAALALCGCRMPPAQPEQGLARPSGLFLVEYYDEADVARSAVSRYFGHHGETRLRCVNAAGGDYYVETGDLRELSILDRTTAEEIASWPSYFSEPADIPQVRLRMVSSDGSSETHSMYATLYFHFTDGDGGSRMSLHPGQIRTVRYPP